MGSNPEIFFFSSFSLTLMAGNVNIGDEDG
jgi:hypothetical protein